LHIGISYAILIAKTYFRLSRSNAGVFLINSWKR